MNKAYKILSIIIMAAVLVSLVPFGAEASSSTHVSISVSPNEASPNQNVTFTIALRNTNSAPSSTDNPSGDSAGRSSEGSGYYTGISISNTYGIGFSTSGVSVAPGKHETFSGSWDIPEEYLDTDLTFTVSWYDYGQKVSESVSCRVKRRNLTPYLRVTRTANPVSAAPGTDVTFKYTFTNAGPVTLVNIELTDVKVFMRSSPAYRIDILEPGATVEYTYVMRMGSSTVVSSPKVTFYAQGGTTQLVNKVADMTIGLINSQLAKEIVVGNPTPEGVQFTIYLTNNGNLNLKSLKITDELGNQVSSDSFSLAVGEYRVFEYFVPNPEEIRNVVFYIKGYDPSGTIFKDNTASYTVRPYVDASKIKLEFTAVTASSMNDEHVIGIEFSVANTGELDLYNVSVTEQQLGYEIKKWTSFAAGTNDKIQTDINIGSVRDLVFVLTAEDSSGNVYTYEAHVSADKIDVSSMFPYKDPSQGGSSDIGVITEDNDLGGRLDGLITKAGEKLQKWFRILGIVAGSAALLMLGLAIAEIVIRRNNRAEDKNQ
ncbi:MAG: hypothetical protein K6F68_09255 [Clostridiales bacterium]|nr:hypothetical protein [Clostridiales bacterium]